LEYPTVYVPDNDMSIGRRSKSTESLLFMRVSHPRSLTTPASRVTRSLRRQTSTDGSRLSNQAVWLIRSLMNRSMNAGR